MQRHRSSAAPLALAYAALIVYASLYPFSDWRWPPGLDAAALPVLPWLRIWTAFDVVSNLLGYLPFGVLLYVAVVRNAERSPWAVAGALLAPVALSYAMEVTQNFLPTRVPSRLDWLLNSAGALCGAALAALLHRQGALAHWQAVRERWFQPGGAAALALLLLWPLGLLIPTAVPLGLGQVMDPLREVLQAAVQDTPWADGVDAWIQVARAGVVSDSRLAPVTEWTLSVLGLLAPCLLAFSVMRPGWRRAAVAAGVAVAAFATTTLSTALNFGPQHALAWLSPVSMPAFGAGLGFALTLSVVDRRVAAAIGLMALSALVALVAQAPGDPYFASSLHAWEQGRFIRFHGLARWVGWLWPYAALLVLLQRVAAPQRE